jgi:adenylate cyclase
MSVPAGSAVGRILVVDDNKMNRMLLGRVLEEQGHAVGFAEDGQEALDRVRSEAFDLVLLDVVMPRVDGFEVLSVMKGDSRLCDLPVIVTSSLDEFDGVIRCIELGAEDYLTKPVNGVLLRARVTSSLDKKRLHDERRELFGKFATPEVADDLVASGLTLGGKAVDAAALFCDIRSFTSIAEAQTPAETIELLNDYYALVIDATVREGGIVSMLAGDGLMAIFGAPTPTPDFRLRAVRAARKMVDSVDLFSREQKLLGKTQIKIGVGIASGNVVAGYTGTQYRATYTCVGDAVNLASRLESHTKVIGRPILIDEETRNGLDGVIPVEAHGELIVTGKTRAVNVYSVADALRSD